MKWIGHPRGGPAPHFEKAFFLPWSSSFEDPIPLPRGRSLATLKDAADYITKLQLAAFSSLYPLGTNVKGSIGLSHTIGYAIGSPYNIPHGITSCISLAGVVRLKSNNPAEAEQIARALPYIGKGARSGNDREDALKVADAIDELVNGLGLGSTLTEYGVKEDQIAKIAKTATKSESGELYDEVVKLVTSKL